jgi:hypothetical protein
MVLEPIVEMMQGVTQAEDQGLPPGSLSVILEGSSDETLHAWEKLKEVACLRDAMKQWYIERANRMPARWEDDKFHQLYHHAYDVPEQFVDTMRAIVQRTSIIHFDGYPGDLWDTTSMFSRSRDWSLQDWWLEYSSITGGKARVKDWVGTLHRKYDVES